MLNYCELPDSFICISPEYRVDGNNTKALLVEQLRWKLTNLKYQTVETRCCYTYLQNGRPHILEDTVFIVFTTKLFELMHLATKYNQPAILVKDSKRFVLLDTSLGNILKTFSMELDIKTMQDAIQSYFLTKHQLASNVEVTLEVTDK